MPTSPPTRALVALRLLYSPLLAATLVLGAPYWLARMLLSPRHRAGLPDRLGRTPRALRHRPPSSETIWLHAVSVGELLAALGLLRALTRELPGWTIAVSTTTAAAQQLARERLPGSPVFYLPLDFAVLMRRTLRRLRPRLVLLMESELWPNMLLEAHRARIPVAVANARISDRSFPRYLRLRRLWRPLFALVARFFAQSKETAARLRQIGATPGQISTPGNLKFDLPAAATSPLLDRIRDRLPAGAPVLVAGSTLEGEERLLLEAWTTILAAEPRAVLILAPRHPQRFDAVAALLREHGLAFTRASTIAAPLSPGSLLLLDTIGDLAAVYSLATVSFVGGSLVDAGGHNPLEPARFGVPVLLGPYVANFREIVSKMQAIDGVLLTTAATLAPSVLALCRDSAARTALGERGRSVFERETGATARTVHELLALLRPSLASAAALTPSAALVPGDSLASVGDTPP